MRQATGEDTMPLTSRVQKDMLECVPSLRAFAISLSGNVDRAEDLVQETLTRAIANIDTFDPITNMGAWLFTILRNVFRSQYRKRRREVEDADGSYVESLKKLPEQYGCVELSEFRAALAQMKPHEREVLILVGASGYTYEETAVVLDCPVGTVKSRLNRARTNLAKLLDHDEDHEFGPDCLMQAVLAQTVRN